MLGTEVRLERNTGSGEVLLIDPGLRGIIFLRVLTSKLSLEAPNTTFFDRLDIFSDAINPTIILVVFISAQPDPQATARPLKKVRFFPQSSLFP